MEVVRRKPEDRMLSFSPWKRNRSEKFGPYSIYRNAYWEKFNHFKDSNIDLDIHTKRVALKAAPSVVSIVTLSGEKTLFMGSGTIVGCEYVNGTYISTILTSATLLRSKSDVVPEDLKVDVYISDGTLFGGQMLTYDLHYNIATLKIESKAAMPIASIRFIDDSLSIDPNEIEDKGVGSSSQLRPRSSLFNLCPGDMVVAIGRYFEEPHELMAAPGKFSLDCCKFDCRELYRANCLISKCGIGGPLVNRFGEVIGVNFYDSLCTPFLPINIASKCLEYFKKHGRFYRPWLGMELTNLHAASVGMSEKILQQFPNIFNGVLVEKVIEESPAECAGILPDDIIVQCGENIVRGFLEFYERIWDKAGESVEVVVIRQETSARLKMTLEVDEFSPDDEFNRWPLPRAHLSMVGRIR